MNTMRVPVLATALLLTAAALSGCFGGDDEATPASVDDGGGQTPPLGGGEVPTGGELKVLAPLQTAVTSTSAAWVKSGAQIDVAAKAPDRANGTVKYTWAVGPLPDTVEAKGAADTKTIEPGKTGSLKFSVSGVYRMHCHPHPAMKHNVTVIEGYSGPATVHVQIVDGAKLNEYRFIPENIVVGKDTTVVYHNNGTQAHTATLEKLEPPLKKADLSAASGKVTVEGNGWMRVLVVATDSQGRIGSAEHAVYVTPELPQPFTKQVTCEIPVGSQGALPGEATSVAAPDCSETIPVPNAGDLTLNWSAQDAVASESGGAAPPEANTATAEIHFARQGEQQDLVTGDAAAAGSLSGKVEAAPYVLTVKGVGGAGLTVVVDITVVPDMVPPPPSKASAAGGDGHGGHAH